MSQLATVSVPAVASNGMTTLTRTVNVGTLSTGRYFVVVRGDDPGALIEQNDVSNKFHEDVCTETKKVAATGTDKEVGGKHQFTATKIALAK